ncbi:MAG: hypothetical protein NTV00_00505 [Methylococcales bacterium]|nr:hypothetical protein [Methylococcales bacterium]
MLKLNQLIPTLSVGLLLMSTNVYSLEVLGRGDREFIVEPWPVLKALMDWRALNYYDNNLTRPTTPDFGSTVALEYTVNLYGVNLYFERADKARFPVAPKDSSGNFYLELGPPYAKALRIPTEMGNFYVNLDALRVKKAISDIRATRFYDVSDIRFRDAYALDYSRVEGVTSAKQWPQVDVFTRNTYDGDWAIETQVDHGGGWVGVTTITYGLVDADVTTTICGVPTVPNELKYKIVDRGVLVGYWRARYARTDCEAGQIKTTTVSKGAPFNTLVDLVNFK